MGYWVAGQVKPMISSVMYKSKFSMVNMILRRILTIPCKMFLRYHLENTRSITTFHFNIKSSLLKSLFTLTL